MAGSVPQGLSRTQVLSYLIVILGRKYRISSHNSVNYVLVPPLVLVRAIVCGPTPRPVVRRSTLNVVRLTRHVNRLPFNASRYTSSVIRVTLYASRYTRHVICRLLYGGHLMRHVIRRLLYGDRITRHVNRPSMSAST